MNIAISVAHEVDLNSVVRFERSSRIDSSQITVFAPHAPPIDNYICVGNANPFYSDGRHLNSEFYLASTPPEQLNLQSTVFGWWRNDIYMRTTGLVFDVVVAVDGLDRFDFKEVPNPDYGSILCNDEFEAHPLSANFSCWAAKPSDYSRLSTAWKFFRFVNHKHTHLDMHGKNIQLDDEHANYLWKFWLDVQNISVRKYEA